MALEMRKRFRTSRRARFLQTKGRDGRTVRDEGGFLRGRTDMGELTRYNAEFLIGDARSFDPLSQTPPDRELQWLGRGAEEFGPDIAAGVRAFCENERHQRVEVGF
mgnify:CR=1 FL=1